MLSGLDPELSYDFRFFASFRSSRSQSTSYMLWGDGEPLTGILQTSGSDIGGQNTNSAVTISGVRPDRFGQIFIDVEPVGLNDSFLSNMEITVVREPSTLMLAMLGLLGLGFYGYRRRWAATDEELKIDIW